MSISSPTENARNLPAQIPGWLFGFVTIAIGTVNLFWGNDPGFGAFLLLLSLVFFPPFNLVFKRLTGYTIPWFAKILLAAFILWAALGVGELPEKIAMMVNDLK